MINWYINFITNHRQYLYLCHAIIPCVELVVFLILRNLCSCLFILPIFWSVFCKLLESFAGNMSTFFQKFVETLSGILVVTSTSVVLNPAFIVHYSCIAVSCSGCISVSAPTTAVQYCKEVNLSAVRWVALW